MNTSSMKPPEGARASIGQCSQKRWMPWQDDGLTHAWQGICLAAWGKAHCTWRLADMSCRISFRLCWMVTACCWSCKRRTASCELSRMWLSSSACRFRSAVIRSKACIAETIRSATAATKSPVERFSCEGASRNQLCSRMQAEGSIIYCRGGPGASC